MNLYKITVSEGNMDYEYYMMSSSKEDAIYGWFQRNYLECSLTTAEIKAELM
jgi:hypothetical protein